ncbi:peptidyl-prolyl cis-trans isomerase B (cyclophilin B) [Reichenbachiella faecimaris]|uniref:Peptidyl-prolyl cis-trans isomerase n=1 Tax=Reichenbachiella faecimaris TaxID=692418 RepID=A0A1W2GL72_REIFA|nr:peptidylprolyl isomerase [Reichenbachiella faecimaris]SMD37036.1 peptidyl-prolyl cis-trans isomerase B (cyclophilin B) [Reichenbachiella faecimaris]
MKNIIILLAVATFFSCTKKPESMESVAESRATIEMVTDYGVIVLELYNETPKHRDNFVKLAKDGVFDSVLFHRVIENFMIQGGDPDSKNAEPGDTLGNGGLGYRVDAEFNPTLFHKKGALGAARDGNLARASSSTQFYIVQGKVFNDSLLEVAEGRINGWLKENAFKKDSANQPIVDELVRAEEEENWELYTQINDSIKTLAEDYQGSETYSIPEAQREVYKSVGGTPHLDQNYTVFGEVIKGLAVVDSIAAVQTGAFDRPVKDVRILTVRVIDKEKK